MHERDFVEKFWIVVGWLVVVALAAGAAYMVLVKRVELVKMEEVRQQQIDTFYVQHSCRPEGYVAGKYHPIRTYRCDNGLFIAADMR